MRACNVCTYVRRMNAVSVRAGTCPIIDRALDFELHRLDVARGFAG